MVNKLERWLENINENAKEQALRFLLNDQLENKDGWKLREVLLKQIEEFSRMYPPFVEEEEE